MGVELSFDGWMQIIGIGVIGWSAYYAGRALLRAIAAKPLPLERSLLQVLQDRAAARALGIDREVLKARRKMDGHG